MNQKQSFTREEVIQMLVSVFIFANANNNQGINQIEGINYGEMAETVISANESEGTKSSILSILSKFKVK